MDLSRYCRNNRTPGYLGSIHDSYGAHQRIVDKCSCVCKSANDGSMAGEVLVQGAKCLENKGYRILNGEHHCSRGSFASMSTRHAKPHPATRFD